MTISFALAQGVHGILKHSFAVSLTVTLKGESYGHPEKKKSIKQREMQVIKCWYYISLLSEGFRVRFGSD